MKYFTLLICTLIFSIFLNGCAGNQAKFNSLGKTSKKKPTFAQTLTAELDELSKKPVRTTVDVKQERAQMGKDNSIVQTVYDAFGNKTESRVFYNDSLLKMVVLQTSADGQKQALIYGQNGEVKTAPQNLLDRVLTSVAGEIAKTVEIFEGRREIEVLAKLETVQTPSNEDFSAVNSKSLIVETPAPIVKNEQVAEAVEIPAKILQANKDVAKTIEPEDSALKLRAAVQALKANRVNSLAKNFTAKAN